MGLHGDDHLVTGNQDVEHKQAQGGGAVNDTVIVVLAQESQFLGEDHLPAGCGAKIQLSGAELEVAGDEVKTGYLGMHDGIRHGHVFVHQHIVDRCLDPIGIDAQTQTGVPLGIEID